MFRTGTLQITPEILNLIAGLDEFKGAWQALGTLAPERLSALRRVATIESIGSSTRIEGSKLSDREVERLLSNLEIKSFATRDEQEVAGYAETMELLFQSWREITLTENHVKQLHRDLLQYSEKDAHHRGNYKANQTTLLRSTRPENRSELCSKQHLLLTLRDGCLNSLPGPQTHTHRDNCILSWSLRSSRSCFSKSIHFRTAMAD
jgi:Fic family protein